MSVLVTQEVAEVVVYPTTAAVRLSQGVLEVVVNTNESDNPAQPSPSVSTASLPDGEVDAAYSQGLSATSGTLPYSWDVSSGSLPAGLTLGGSTISGTPTAAGVSSFTVRVTDLLGKTATQDLSITIAEAPSSGNAAITVHILRSARRFGRR